MAFLPYSSVVSLLLELVRTTVCVVDSCKNCVSTADVYMKNRLHDYKTKML